MNIYLVQHGQANSKSVDPTRSLSEPGRQEVKQVAAFAGQLGLAGAQPNPYSPAYRRYRSSSPASSDWPRPTLLKGTRHLPIATLVRNIATCAVSLRGRN